jgi:hypothetical protein
VTVLWLIGVVLGLMVDIVKDSYASVLGLFGAVVWLVVYSCEKQLCGCSWAVWRLSGVVLRLMVDIVKGSYAAVLCLFRIWFGAVGLM